MALEEQQMVPIVHADIDTKEAGKEQQATKTSKESAV